MDFFDGPGTITQPMLDYVSYTGVNKGTNEQAIAGATVSGKLFDIPSGGPVSVAVGAQYDRENGSFTPDPYQSAGDNLDAAVAPTGGHFDVFAGFAEISATLLQHLPAVDRLELSGAIRAGSYSTFGGFSTYKGGLRWQIVPDFALRGTASTAFRAPTVGELFAGNATSFPTIQGGDPCDVNPTNMKCVAQGVPPDFADTQLQLPENVGGNPNLQPEKATTYTAGIVYTPSFFKGFSVTLDYFNIDINNAIDQEGATVILNNCYVAGNDGDCAKIHRDPATHSIVLIDDLLLNTPGLRTAGMDFDVAYRFRVNKIGNLRVNVEGTWLHKFEKTIVGGTTIDGLNNYDLTQVNPSIKFNFNVFWAKAGWNAAATVRFVGPWHECFNNDCSSAGLMAAAQECADPMDGAGCNPIRDVDPYVTLNLQVGKEFTSPLGKTGFTVGVLNLFDKDPPLLYSGGSITASDAATYDYLGRFVYARLSQSF
jgi:outer membrane receptor protein involved in Fe transport